MFENWARKHLSLTLIRKMLIVLSILGVFLYVLGIVGTLMLAMIYTRETYSLFAVLYSLAHMLLVICFCLFFLVVADNIAPIWHRETDDD